MALNQVTSSYNVRRRKQSATLHSLAHDPDSIRLAKRPKLEKRDVFTPPASPEASDLLTTTTLQTCYDDDHEDPILIGIVDFMQRTGVPAMCSREISEALQAEGKVKLTGSTPSTLVDAAIKQHHKRCSSTNRPNIIQKIADPRFPRKTLYHLATAEPFGPMPSLLSSVDSPNGDSPAARSSRTMTRQQQQQQADALSEMSASEDEDIHDDVDTLSNDGQGPFTASLDTRRRMSISPSPELEFSLSLQDAKRSIATPVASEPASPLKDASRRAELRSQVNIALPPSPFILPHASYEDQDVVDGPDCDSQPTLKLPSSSQAYKELSPFLMRMRHDTKYHDKSDEFYDVELSSPEALTLDDLETLLNF